MRFPYLQLVFGVNKRRIKFTYFVKSNSKSKQNSQGLIQISSTKARQHQKQNIEK